MLSMTRTSSFLFLWHCLFALFLSYAAGQDYTDECPEPNGFYADALQCDRYYECKDSQISDKLCPDGLVFDEDSTVFAKCSFPFAINCTGRTELQPAKPTALCPRQNGYFVHEDPKVCDKFYFCVDGLANPLSCPESLIFSPANGQCSYSDQIKREGCSSEDFFGFQCPNDPNNSHAHPRYPDPADCQYFFLCFNGKDPRRNGCQTGLVFNPETVACDRQENLDINEPCSRHYNETTIEGLKESGSIGSIRGRLPPGVKNTGNGIKLDTRNRQRVAVVRKKKVRPQQQAIQSPVSAQEPSRGAVGSVAGSAVTGSRRRVPAGDRLRAQGASQNRQNVGNIRTGQTSLNPQTVGGGRTRQRTRVRNPNLPGNVQQVPVAADEPAGPPKFSLSDDESIQKFRDSLSSRFAPESSRPSNRDRVRGSTGGNRLTVLSSRRRNPANSPQPADDPKSEFGSFSAIPDTPANFGNRVRSRRPPSFQDSNLGSQEVSSLPVRRAVGGNSERIQQVDFENDGGFGSFDRRTRNPTTDEIRSLPVRKQGGRLQVQKIDVQPQFDLASIVEETLDRQEGGGRAEDSGNQFTSFPAFESGRQRSRGQQG